MFDGFLKVAAATPDVHVADTAYNAEKIIKLMERAWEEKVKLLVLPELCISAYTCGDLFHQESLLAASREALLCLVERSKGRDMLVVAGLPLKAGPGLYNVAAVFSDGEILGFVPKTHIPNYSEFYEGRHFSAAPAETYDIDFEGRSCPFGTKILFECRQMPEFVLGVEICEDLWVSSPPSIDHAKAGATVIANLSASDEISGKSEYRRELVKGQSARLISGYIYANAGEGESSTDLVFSGHDMICENGSMLAEAKPFSGDMIISEIDLSKLMAERSRKTVWQTGGEVTYRKVYFDLEKEETVLSRHISPRPFIPEEEELREHRCEEILTIQAMGLKKRLSHTNSKSAVIGISGGLDSTLALLVTVRAFDMLGIDRSSIHAVTMPCFGTTDRTYNNACELVKRLGASLKEINIREAVTVHLRDIGQDMDDHDTTFENSQARERTQVLMDYANRTGAMVVGTGDLSELALGWATYNGDHMSMYGVNGSVPKTLVRHLVRHCAESSEDKALKETLLDILDTPVSPELIPPKDGEISQKTEDLVGPYELHDFFIFHMLRYGMRPGKLFRLALCAFGEEYDRDTVLKWLRTFYRRFFSQQFKRSCLPDGPKVGSVGVSPRGDLRMPSDACVDVWMRELETIV